MSIVSFETSMLEEAGVLLAKRHQWDRLECTLLPEKYEDPAVAAEAVKELWEKPGAMGVALTEKGILVGYLIGNVVINSLRGRHAWVHPAGFAMDGSENYDLFRDMYAVLGEEWVKNGIFDHYILVPGSGGMELNPWLHAGFGFEQTHALLDLKELELESYKTNNNLFVRKVSSRDRETLESFSTIISRGHAGSPVWGVSLPEDVPETRDGYGEIVEEETFITWLAFLNDQPIGMQAYNTNKGSSHILPDKTIGLTVGSTFVEARGQGVSTTLFVNGLRHAIEQGFEYCETDWRTAHLLSSRHWPKLGFKPVAQRLVRKVDPRIVWANGFNEMNLSGKKR